ncbi:hypothetical protein EVAR_81019_1 [Eumeta japonica]|uniref:Uncharacterized protein n=1 Tax=Eumeta variegata TaxID=151549 RepID=A0A4C1T5P7_EUMVA|nr:hypothetical protein EVAR_81019_1 [Eumeta japonica]
MLHKYLAGRDLSIGFRPEPECTERVDGFFSLTIEKNPSYEQELIRERKRARSREGSRERKKQTLGARTWPTSRPHTPGPRIPAPAPVLSSSPEFPLRLLVIYGHVNDHHARTGRFQICEQLINDFYVKSNFTSRSTRARAKLRVGGHIVVMGRCGYQPPGA